MDTFDHTPLTPPETPGDSPAQHTESVFSEIRPEPAPQPEIPAWSGAPEAQIPEAPKPYFVPRPQPRQEAPARQEMPVQPESTPQLPPKHHAPRPSPYENSPYVRMPRQEEPFPYTPQRQPAPSQTPGKKSGFWRRFLAAVLTIALVAGGCGITALAVNRYWETRTAQTTEQMNLQLQQLQQQLLDLQNRTNTSSGNLITGPAVSGEAMTPAQVYDQCVSSVVAINIQVDSYYYGQSATAGSGFILTEDGYVVTNYHVVEGSTGVSVGFSDGSTLPAAVVGFDATNDVAVLKVEAQGLPAARLGSSRLVNVGDMVVAIGNPLGELNATQTVGYICGKDREITTGGTIINMLQTDAAINPGNSGGPLFNMAGEVIGITTAKYSGTTSSGASIEGIGFAIPIDDIMGIIGDLQAYGYVTGAYLGITVQNVDSSVSEVYGISGAYVIGVEPGYAADRAGIRAKDLIVSLDGKEIGSITDLTRALRDYEAGDVVTIGLIRNGQSMDVAVTLDEKPRDLTQPTPEYEEEMPSEGDYDEWYDFFFGN